MTEERYRHKKRGSTYTIIARSFFQVDGDLDNEKVVVYRGEDGRVWVRPEYEFNDGRFERLPDEVTELNGPILKYISRDAKRETFEVPEGYEAVRDADGRATGEVRDADGRATGEVRKVDPTTTAKAMADTRANERLAFAALRLVVSYDDLLRRYAGPLDILGSGDNAVIDEAYDHMVIAARTTLEVVGPSSIAPAPHVTVPVDPTDAMIEAALAVDWECDGDEKAAAINVWYAMLAAATEGSENG